MFAFFLVGRAVQLSSLMRKWRFPPSGYWRFWPASSMREKEETVCSLNDRLFCLQKFNPKMGPDSFLKAVRCSAKKWPAVLNLDVAFLLVFLAIATCKWKNRGSSFLKITVGRCHINLPTSVLQVRWSKILFQPGHLLLSQPQKKQTLIDFLFFRWTAIVEDSDLYSSWLFSSLTYSLTSSSSKSEAIIWDEVF